MDSFSKNFTGRLKFSRVILRFFHGLKWTFTGRNLRIFHGWDILFTGSFLCYFSITNKFILNKLCKLLIIAGVFHFCGFGFFSRGDSKLSFQYALSSRFILILNCSIGGFNKKKFTEFGHLPMVFSKNAVGERGGRSLFLNEVILL